MPPDKPLASPIIPDPTHHVVLTDRNGVTVGLIMVDTKGQISPYFRVTPVQRTALKTTSGSDSYDSLQYPYNPIVQDDWSGGMNNLDFERDTTKFFDSNRMRTSRTNKAFHGPQEQYTKGYRSQDYSVPGNVNFHALTDSSRFIAKKFTASASYTAALIHLNIRKKGKPEDMTIDFYSDNAGQINALLSSITLTKDRLPDILSEWLSETVSQLLANGTPYWIVLSASANDTSDNHWELAVKPSANTTYESSVGGAWGNWSAASYDLYFHITDADTEKYCKFFEYKQQQYKVVSGVSGAPKVYMNGDRGAADSNSGALTKLKDASKSWTTNAWAGCVVVITDGPGKTEREPFRVITSNTASELAVSPAWNVEHTTSTEYIIVASDTWREITGHGMTVPVTDVLVSTQGVVYFCLGDANKIKRHREWNNGGTWQENTATEWADEGNAASYATFMVYKPQNNDIVIAKNSNSAGVAVVTTEVMSNASPPVWGTDLTWAAAVPIGDIYERITGLEVYPDDGGVEAVKVYKTSLPWVLPTSGGAYPINLREMKVTRSVKNGRAHEIHNVYEYFSLGNGVTRYYGGNFEEVGPSSSGEGLPVERQGAIVSIVGYPGKVFIIVDGGSTGYSSLLMRDGSGYHEHYRAPLGQRLLGAGFQPVPGVTLDRLWLWQGNNVIWLPFPSDTTNELDDPNYLYTHEASIVMSRYHAGLFDVQKMVRIIKLQTENLVKDVCWIEMDYRLNENTAWTTIGTIFTTSPTQEIDLIDNFGMAGKRIQLRLRTYTTNASLTPILLAIIVEAVMRNRIKNQYPVVFRIMEREEWLTGRKHEALTPDEKLLQLQKWADDRSDSMLKMTSISSLYNEKMVFLNAIEVEQIFMKPEPEKNEGQNVWVCISSLQEA